MIAVDTNVLLRYLLKDEPAQAERVRALFGNQAGVLITDVVIAETVWTLLGRRYRADKAEVIVAIESLLEEPFVEFEDNRVIWRALQNYRETDAGFADALVVQKALSVALKNGLELQAMYTFDAAALELPAAVEP